MVITVCHEIPIPEPVGEPKESNMNEQPKEEIVIRKNGAAFRATAWEARSGCHGETTRVD